MGQAIKNDAATARDKAVDAGASARDTAEAKRDEAAVRMLEGCIVACFAGKGTSAAALSVGCLLLLHGPELRAGATPRSSAEEQVGCECWPGLCTQRPPPLDVSRSHVS